MQCSADAQFLFDSLADWMPNMRSYVMCCYCMTSSHTANKSKIITRNRLNRLNCTPAVESHTVHVLSQLPDKKDLHTDTVIELWSWPFGNDQSCFLRHIKEQAFRFWLTVRPPSINSSLSLKRSLIGSTASAPLPFSPVSGPCACASGSN